MRITAKKRAFGFGALVQTIRNWLHLEYIMWFTPTTSRPKTPTPLNSFYVWLRYFALHQLKYKCWTIFRSFKWHLKCYLMFWRLPSIIETLNNGFYAQSSIIKDKDNIDYDEIAEPYMEEIVDQIWCDELKDKEYSETTEDEKNAIHKLIKAKYEHYNLYCPDEYLTEDESWDRAERSYEDGRTDDYDDRPSLVHGAFNVIKKYKIKSSYYGDNNES